MEEFKFVIKCFIFSCLLVVFSQTPIQGYTLEQKAQTFLLYSKSAQYLRESAQGGAMILKESYTKVASYVQAYTHRGIQNYESPQRQKHIEFNSRADQSQEDEFLEK